MNFIINFNYNVFVLVYILSLNFFAVDLTNVKVVTVGNRHAWVTLHVIFMLHIHA